MTAEELRALADAEGRLAEVSGMADVTPYEFASRKAHHARIALALREAAELRERVERIEREERRRGGDVDAHALAERLRAALARESE